MPKLMRNAFYHLAIILVGLFMLYPLAWMVSSSFKEAPAIFQSVKFFPDPAILTNYINGWKGLSGIGFSTFFRNSLTIVLFIIVGNIASCLLAAFAFARLKFKAQAFWFSMMLGTMMLPGHVRLIPQYIIFNKLGWINTYFPLIVPSFFATQGFFIFLMTQFMRGLPRELDEAATVDGCGPFRLFTQILVPLSTPAIVTTSIFSFIWTWNDFFSQMLYINDLRKATVALALRMYVDASGSSSWGALFAMSTLSLLPLFIMFIVFQRYLIEGITAGGIKG
ncbi:MAG: carbohydrate ABC transporter permease [Clostridiales bacterium]|nr:carbohydrate ABC transporter permease [Clostridiales bacterium]